MQKRIERLRRARLNEKTLAKLMAAVFFCSLIPLIAIALYNYPADDDFGFVLPAATAWVNTGSLWEVAKAIWQKTCDTYMTWQGNFASTAYFAITPIIFNIDLYFLSNWFTLALLCLSTGYLLKGALCVHLHVKRPTFWIVYVALVTLMLQFMPDIGYSIYWHNGGTYTLTVCFLMLLLGLLLRTLVPQSHLRGAARAVLAALCAFILGGSFYGPMLGAFVMLVLLTFTLFIERRKPRPLPIAFWASLTAFAAALIISLLAPGNALRQERTGDGTANGALFTIVTAVLDSFDLTGRWITPQLLAMLMLVVPALWRPLRDSSFSFRHPLWTAVMLYGLFSASLAPGIYTGYGYDTSRYVDALYLYFLLFAFGSVVYAEGWLIRRLEGASGESAAHLLEAARNLGTRFSAIYLAVVIALTALGGFAFTIMNTSSVSAAKSLLTGEAARFREEMTDRQEYIRVTDSDVVDVKPLSGQPYVFKNDRLPWQGIYGRVRYMKWYFELFYNAEHPQTDAP